VSRPARSRATLLLLASVPIWVAAGCSTQTIRPGPDAALPACAALTERLPARVLNRARSELDVTGAAAWGDPAIVLRCGVPPTGPTTDPCLEANGLDWTFSQTKDTLRFVSFGRVPAIEVQVPASVGRENATAALIDLATAVRPIAATSHCIGPDDA
jgi:hypothetical protein